MESYDSITDHFTAQLKVAVVTITEDCFSSEASLNI
jgi:hypothetical protein